MAEEITKPKLSKIFKVHSADVDFIITIAFFAGIVVGVFITNSIWNILLKL